MIWDKLGGDTKMDCLTCYPQIRKAPNSKTWVIRAMKSEMLFKHAKLADFFSIADIML